MGKEVSAGGLAEDVSVEIGYAKVLLSSMEDKLMLQLQNLRLPGAYGEMIRHHVEELRTLISITAGVLTDAEEDQDKLVDILYRRKSNAEAD